MNFDHLDVQFSLNGFQINNMGNRLLCQSPFDELNGRKEGNIVYHTSLLLSQYRPSYLSFECTQAFYTCLTNGFEHTVTQDV